MGGIAEVSERIAPTKLKRESVRAAAHQHTERQAAQHNRDGRKAIGDDPAPTTRFLCLSDGDHRKETELLGAKPKPPAAVAQRASQVYIDQMCCESLRRYLIQAVSTAAALATRLEVGEIGFDLCDIGLWWFTIIGGHGVHWLCQLCFILFFVFSKNGNSTRF